jgi:hypothetical protein
MEEETKMSLRRSMGAEGDVEIAKGDLRM